MKINEIQLNLKKFNGSHSKSNKLSEQVFWYKADGHRDFKLGSKEFWELSRNLGSDDEDEPYDPNSYVKRSSAPKINVKKTKW